MAQTGYATFRMLSFTGPINWKKDIMPCSMTFIQAAADTIKREKKWFCIVAYLFYESNIMLQNQAVISIFLLGNGYNHNFLQAVNIVNRTEFCSTSTDNQLLQ